METGRHRRTGRVFPIAVLTFVLTTLPATGHASVNLVNRQGATAPCTGIGPIGGPLAEQCGKAFEDNGFIRDELLGATGLTVGATGDQDGIVTAVAAGSPAAKAGLAVGDIIQSVDDKPVLDTPGAVATRLAFGPHGEKLALTIRRAGTDSQLTLVRGALTVANAPKSPNILVGVHPLVNWRGEFAPCMGAGPLGPGFIAYCTTHFKPYGYIKVTDAGSTGFTLDTARADMAVVTAVEAGSPAAKAGLMVGDQLVAVNNQALISSPGAAANELLFGKQGETRRLTVKRAKATKTVSLTLGPVAGR